MRKKHIFFELQGEQPELAIIRLTRGTRHVTLNDGLILCLRHLFEAMHASVRAAIIDGERDHFCADLNLNELQDRDTGQGRQHSRMWHSAFECEQFGPAPAVAALHVAVAGGGLDLASACNIRVADDTTVYASTEGSRGIFVGDGCVRIPRPFGVARRTNMMLTGRIYNALDGERIGLAQ
jgi:enoyl-CoA hydratase/carnithine racemase